MYYRNSLNNLIFSVLLVSIISIHLYYCHQIRTRRAAYDLPAGAQEILGKPIDMSFKCPGDGYYADVKNDCKIYHRCLLHHKAGGSKHQLHETFVCGNKTVFDQSSLVCKHDDDAIPCDASEMFYYLNERIGDMNAQFLGPADIDRARAARPDFRARGRARAARARAARARAA